MKTLFFVGNKRSGTSLLVRLLNRHQNVFVSHESGTLLLLYQWATGKPYKGPTTDKDPNSVMATLKRYRKVIESDLSIEQKFFQIQENLMTSGSKWLAPMHKTDLAYIGDKTPNAQFELMDFAGKHFPESTYIHIIRHPANWLGSANRFSKKLKYGSDDQDRLDAWVDFEQSAYAAADISVTYESLCANPLSTMTFICDQLGLPPSGMADLPTHFDEVKYHRKLNVDWSEARPIMEIYGYE